MDSKKNKPTKSRPEKEKDKFLKSLKKLNLNQLKRIEARLPQGIVPTGHVLLVVTGETGTEVGTIASKDRPALTPIAELERLAGVSRVIANTDRVENKTKAGDLVKLVASRLKTDEIKFGPASPKAIADAIGMAESLADNLVTVKRNVATLEEGRAIKKMIEDSGQKAVLVLRDYAKHYTTDGGTKLTLLDLCKTWHIPYWLFTRLVTPKWVPDEPQVSLKRILFPKNISNGIKLRVEEWLDKTLIGQYRALMVKSTPVFKALSGEVLQAILGVDPGTFDAKQKRILETTTLPVIPTWTLVENLKAKRTAKAIPARGDVLGVLHYVVHRTLHALVGMRPRNLGASFFWSTLTGHSPDIQGVESHQAQMTNKLEERKVTETKLDRFLNNRGAYTDEDMFAILFGLRGEAKRALCRAYGEEAAAPAAGAGEEKVVVAQEAQAEQAEPEVQAEQVDDVDPWRLFTIRKNARTKLPEFSEAEKRLIANKKFNLPVPTERKGRKYPAGKGLTPSANRLLAAIRGEGKQFHSLYPELLQLFSSFRSDDFTNRAVEIAQSEMVRLRGEGVFFNIQGFVEQIAHEADDNSGEDEDLEILAET